MDKVEPVKIKRTQRGYTLDLKLLVIDRAEKSDMTHNQAQQYYGTQGRSTVLF